MVLLSLSNYLTLLLPVIAFVGDFFVSHSSMVICKAVFDNATHAFIGGISWLIVSVNYKTLRAVYTIYEVALCTAIASFIDLDHFFAAKSLQLKDAVSLPNRPALHSSTAPLVFSVLFFLIAYYWIKSWTLVRIACVIFVAFASHHSRDANRHGYWFSPFGSTAPLPYYLYLALTMFIPHFVMYFISCLDVKLLKVYQQPFVA